jgi:hypothetical protein
MRFYALISEDISTSSGSRNSLNAVKRKPSDIYCMRKWSGPTAISRVLPLVTSPLVNMSLAHERSSTPKPTIVKTERISPSPPLRSVSPEQKPSTSTDPRDIDYRRNPELYKILRGEMNVFKTQPYSDELKGLWRFKDEVTARRSSAELYEKFEGFR